MKDVSIPSSDFNDWETRQVGGSMTILSWTLHEMRLQWKNGLYGVYLIINAIYIFLMAYIPEQWKEMSAILIIFSDPTFLGMIFVGGILLLERNGGIPKGIGISPLGSKGYRISKVVSLLVIALLTSVCIMIAGGISITITRLVTIAVSGSIFTLLGIIIACYSKSINHFMLLNGGVTSPLILPILTYYFFPNIHIFDWIPSYSIIRLLIGDMNLAATFIHLILLFIWLITIYIITGRILIKRLFVR